MKASETERSDFSAPQLGRLPFDSNVLRSHRPQKAATFYVLLKHDVDSSQTDRQFRHSLSANGGIDSFCTRCGALVAWANDEWLLLDDERRHVCRGK